MSDHFDSYKGRLPSKMVVAVLYIPLQNETLINIAMDF